MLAWIATWLRVSLERHQLPHRPQVNVEHIANEGHLPYESSHVLHPGLGHVLLEQRQLLLGHHDVQMDGAAAFPTHQGGSFRSLRA